MLRSMNRFAKASLLLCFFCICAAAVVMSHRTLERRPAPVPQELFAVVQAQLVAFRADDFRSAYLYAASGVQQKLSLPQYERLARRDYKTMAQAQRVEFGEVAVEGSDAEVQVFFVAADGAVRGFVYSLVREAHVWKISTVRELEEQWPNERLSGLSV